MKGSLSPSTDRHEALCHIRVKISSATGQIRSGLAPARYPCVANLTGGRGGGGGGAPSRVRFSSSWDRNPCTVANLIGGRGGGGGGAPSRVRFSRSWDRNSCTVANLIGGRGGGGGGAPSRVRFSSSWDRNSGARSCWQIRASTWDKSLPFIIFQGGVVV